MSAALPDRQWAWALLAFLFASTFGLHRIVELDLFQQVAVGRAILSDPASIGVSTFHPAFPGHRYVEDKWLASVLAALADRLAGETGLMLYQIALAGLLGLSWFVAFRAWGAGGGMALLASALCCAACAFRIEPRPETYSAIGVALLLALLRRPTSFRRSVLCVAGLFFLWVQLHGYFVVGLLVLAAAVVAGRRRALLLLATALGCCLLQPQGIAALISPIEQIAMLRRYPFFRDAIQEFQPSTRLLLGFGIAHAALLLSTVAGALLLDRRAAGRSALSRSLAGLVAAAPWIFLQPAGLSAWPYRLTFALLVASLVELPGLLRRRELFPVLMLGGFTVLAIPLIRNLSLLPVASLLLLAPTWSEALREESRSRWRGPVTVCACALVALVAWARLTDRLAAGSDAYPALTGWGIETRVFPAAAVDALEERGWSGRMLNHFDVGGYLLYRLHPESGVFIAGNTSMVPPSFFREYHREVLGQDADVESLPVRYGVRVALLALASPEIEILAARLSRSPTWRLVFLDRSGALFLHGEGERVDLDARVPELLTDFDRSPLPVWSGPLLRPQEALRLGRFLRLGGRGDLAVAVGLAGWRAVGPEARLARFLAEAASDVQLAGQLVEPLEWLHSRETSPDVRSRLARARYVHGVERLASGNLATAEADLERARDLAPGDPGPWVALARLEIDRGDRGRAASLLREGLDRAGGRSRAQILGGDPLLMDLAGPDGGP